MPPSLPPPRANVSSATSAAAPPPSSSASVRRKPSGTTGKPTREEHPRQGRTLPTPKPSIARALSPVPKRPNRVLASNVSGSSRCRKGSPVFRAIAIAEPKPTARGTWTMGAATNYIGTLPTDKFQSARFSPTPCAQPSTQTRAGPRPAPAARNQKVFLTAEGRSPKRRVRT